MSQSERINVIIKQFNTKQCHNKELNVNDEIYAGISQSKRENENESNCDTLFVLRNGRIERNVITATH